MFSETWQRAEPFAVARTGIVRVIQISLGTAHRAKYRAASPGGSLCRKTSTNGRPAQQSRPISCVIRRIGGRNSPPDFHRAPHHTESEAQNDLLHKGRPFLSRKSLLMIPEPWRD